MQAISISMFMDLDRIPDEGPFITTFAMSTENLRIEHARGPSGYGCPIVPNDKLRTYMEDKGIPRGHEGACVLNKHYADGAFKWDGIHLIPKGA